jgi:hypothetical protein
MGLREAILERFPARTHPLTVVSDPDGLLGDPTIAGELSQRGFVLIDEIDPVRLRLDIERARPWSSTKPLVVVTSGALEDLPYDLWFDGVRLSLSLHTFFPKLATPVLRELSLEARERLAEAHAPLKPLGPEGTAAYVLRIVYDIDVTLLRRPAALIAWLRELHERQEVLPSAITTYLLDLLSHEAIYRDWPLDRLLTTQGAFATFLSKQWEAYVATQASGGAAEAATPYIVDFEDRALQDDLAGLVRAGLVQPVALPAPERLPDWARLGAVSTATEERERRIADLSGSLSERAATATTATWTHWQSIIRDLCELRLLIGRGYDADAGRPHAIEANEAVYSAFGRWLQTGYARTGGDRLPVPHHVHHLPHYLARQRRSGGADRIALLVIDGMSALDWSRIVLRWQTRHPDWRMTERYVLAQVPTVTSISRQALISGLRPAQFVETIATTRDEPKRWTAFWANEGMPVGGVGFERLAFDERPDPALPRPAVQALCLVDVSIDEMIHGTSHGDAEFEKDLDVWLDQTSPRMERYLQRLLDVGFVVFVGSDHGHTEARGIGSVSDGLAVDLRARRARVYRERALAEAVRTAYPDAVIWADDGILPAGLRVVMPGNGQAFTKADDLVVTHGGASLDEVVVPFATITQG